jgi:hypothetical protein
MTIRGPKYEFEVGFGEHNQFKNLIYSFLERIYGRDNFITIEGISGRFLKRQDFDPPDRLKSILNYLNTNILFRNLICRKFPEISNYGELVKVFGDNYQEFIEPSGKYFLEVLSLLRNTEKKGINSEISAAYRLSNSLNQKLGIVTDVYRSGTDSTDDIIYGIDIYYIQDEKVHGAQVKPLVSHRKEGDTLIITSAGLIKEYKNVEFIVFILPHSEENPGAEIWSPLTKWFIFYNRPLWIRDKELCFSLGSLLDWGEKV